MHTPGFVVKHLMQHCITGAPTDEATRWDVQPQNSLYFAKNYTREQAFDKDASQHHPARLHLLSGVWIGLSGDQFRHVYDFKIISSQSG
jgi:hypothetical protein